MVSISRSMLLAASLLAFPLAGAMAQHDPSREEGKPNDSSSASASNQTGSSQSTARAIRPPTTLTVSHHLEMRPLRGSQARNRPRSKTPNST